MTVLVGYTSSAQAQRALRRAAEEAALRDVHLHIVSIVQHEEGDSPTQVHSEYESSEKLQDELEQLAERLTRDGLSCDVEVVHSVRRDIAQDLLDAAKAVRAELIVIGMRRRSPVGKLVMGSVAQDILLRADCPVLAVKAGAAGDD